MFSFLWYLDIHVITTGRCACKLLHNNVHVYWLRIHKQLWDYMMYTGSAVGGQHCESDAWCMGNAVCISSYFGDKTCRCWGVYTAEIGSQCHKGLSAFIQSKLSLSGITKIYYVIFLLYAQLVGTYYGMVRVSVRPSVGLSAKLVNTIQTEPLQLGPSNLVHILLMKRTNPIDFSRSGVEDHGHRLDVVKLCKHHVDWTLPARTIKFGTHTTYDKRTNPIDFQGQGSKVKGTCYTLLLLSLVNTIQTEPLQLGPSNLVHILLMTRGRYLLIFKVRGQRSRSHTRHGY